MTILCSHNPVETQLNATQYQSALERSLEQKRPVAALARRHIGRHLFMARSYDPGLWFSATTRFKFDAHAAGIWKRHSQTMDEP